MFKLSKEQLNHFNNKGYLVVENVLSDTDIEKVRKLAIEKGIGDRVDISSLKGTPRYT